MTGLFEMLTLEAQRELIHDSIIELITITVQYPPEKTSDGSRIGYCEPSTLYTKFRENNAQLAEQLAQILTISSHAMEDLQGPLHSAMMEALKEQARTLEIFRNDGRCRQFLPHLMAGVFVWQLSLVAWMEDDGTLKTEIEYWIDESVVDKETCVLIHERMDKMIEVMDGITEIPA